MTHTVSPWSARRRYHHRRRLPDATTALLSTLSRRLATGPVVNNFWFSVRQALRRAGWRLHGDAAGRMSRGSSGWWGIRRLGYPPLMRYAMRWIHAVQLSLQLIVMTLHRGDYILQYMSWNGACSSFNLIFLTFLTREPVFFSFKSYCFVDFCWLLISTYAVDCLEICQMGR